VFNKLDAMPADVRPVAVQDVYELDGRQVPRIFVSARQGDGLAALREQLASMVQAASQDAMTPNGTAELPAPSD
jgi:GTP-binding protein HflX